MSYRAIVALAPCVGALLAAELAGEQIRRDELVRAMADSAEVLSATPSADRPVLPDALAEIRADLSSYAAGLSLVPDVINGLPVGAKEIVLRAKLTLFATDPEYCHAEAKRWLTEAVVMARLSKRIPPLEAEDRQRFTARVDRLVSRTIGSAEAHLRAILPSDEISQDLRRLVAGFTSMMENPTCSSMKRVPSEGEIDALANELEAHSARSEDRWTKIAKAVLPTIGSDGYERARTGLRDVILAELVGFLSQRLSALTTPDWVADFSMDDLAPGYSEAHETSARLFQERITAAHVRAHAAFLARVREARERSSEVARLRRAAFTPAP